MILLSIFSDIFKNIIGIEKVYGLDFTEAFEGIGFSVITISFVMAILFYLVLGKWKPIWNLPSHWKITFAINALLCLLVTILQVNIKVQGIEIFQVIGYLIKISCVSLVSGSLIFLILSLILKRFSTFCKATPRFKIPIINTYI